MENQIEHPLNVVVDDDYNTVEVFAEFLEVKNIVKENEI